MTVQNKIIIDEQEKIVNDLDNDIKQNTQQEEAKLAMLRAKLAAKDNMSITIVEEKKHSLDFGIIGSGQCGSRIAAEMYALGYPGIAINTAQQDLKFISLPDSNKFHAAWGLGGASRDLQIGHDAVEAHRDAIYELISTKLDSANVFVLCASLGGGSGSGSVDVLIDILSSLGKPIVMIAVLPMTSEDLQAKSNTIQTLTKLTNYAKEKKVSNIILVDNAKIESLFSDVSQMDFYSVSNKAIVEPLDLFNVLSSAPSSVKPLDPTEFSRILIDGEAFSVYGSMNVSNYTDETAIAESVLTALTGNLLSSGFDLKQSKYAGLMITANENVLSKIPVSSVNYAMSVLNDICGNSVTKFHGIYTTDSKEDCIKVYSMFSGLGIPLERVSSLQTETKELLAKSKVKNEDRNLTLKIDSGVDENVSAADKIKQKIAAKSSAFGKLTKSAVIDKRK